MKLTSKDKKEINKILEEWSNLELGYWNPLTKCFNDLSFFEHAYKLLKKYLLSLKRDGKQAFAYSIYSPSPWCPQNRKCFIVDIDKETGLVCRMSGSTEAEAFCLALVEKIGSKWQVRKELKGQ